MVREEGNLTGARRMSRGIDDKWLRTLVKRAVSHWIQLGMGIDKLYMFNVMQEIGNHNFTCI